jgi:hypothetical protein
MTSPGASLPRKNIFQPTYDVPYTCLLHPNRLLANFKQASLLRSYLLLTFLEEDYKSSSLRPLYLYRCQSMRAAYSNMNEDILM